MQMPQIDSQKGIKCKNVSFLNVFSDGRVFNILKTGKKKIDNCQFNLHALKLPSFKGNFTPIVLSKV